MIKPIVQVREEIEVNVKDVYFYYHLAGLCTMILRNLYSEPEKSSGMGNG